MNKKLSFIIIALLLSFVQLVNAYGITLSETAKLEAAALSLDAQSALLIDATTGEVLYQKSADERQFPASITKLMTVLLALERGNLDDMVTFSYEATHSIEPGSSNIAIDASEQLTLRQCLYAIILQSANEVSNGVAEHIAGSMDEFALLMTQRAQELGCNGTNFVNAHGLHDENHYTTAKDMSLIAQELLKYDFFLELMGTQFYEILPTAKQPDTINLYVQTSLMRPSSSYYYEKCLGGKTGFTNEAKNTLVSYAKDGETILISVVLASSNFGLYTDTIALFDYGFNNFETKTIATKGDSPVSIGVTETQKKQTFNLGLLDLVYSNDIVATLPKGTNIDDIESSYNILENYEAPIEKGTIISKVEFTLNGDYIDSCDLVADKTIFPSATSAQPLQSTHADKSPISPVIVFALLFLALAALLAMRVVISKIEYENRKKRRKQRLKKLQETYGEIPRKDKR